MATIAMIALAGCASTSSPQAARVSPPPPMYRVSMPVPAPVPVKATAPYGLVSTIQSLRTQFAGNVGIAVRNIDKGWAVTANGSTKLPQQSVSKLWVAMAVLDYRDSGQLTLDDTVTVTREDLTLFHQPIAAMVKGDGYKATVGELLQRALTTSDNTANDRLLRFIGGPETVRGFIRRKGLGSISFGPGERLLQSQTAGLDWKPEFALGNAFTRARARLPLSTRLSAFESYVTNPPDGAAPEAIAGALAMLKKGELLSANSTNYLIATMESARTGKQRLSGAVPAGWRFGHKTGTGQDLAGRTAGYNDVGILTAPDGQSYALAVMIGDTPRPVAERQALMQSVVASVVAYHGR
ncbi:class A beta-lactamase [Sphingomonas sp. 28-62-11]|uniref:class A beta-lactamase n=1 Tax=Sphingomonas sp. 28-62-11 TaxID=1970432 RepID=UPI000BCBD90E|nr:MAG: serine hydrolase [Sphingomonas sp. 28-62-11]